jgi:hypothetical protein
MEKEDVKKVKVEKMQQWWPIIRLGPFKSG